MSRAIRFTKAERDVVADWVARTNAGPARRAGESLLAKMDAASRPPAPTSADFRSCRAPRFLELARRVLGDGLVVVPPTAGPPFWGRIQRLLTEQGITEELAQIGLVHLRSWVRHPRTLAVLANDMPRAIHEARLAPAGEEVGDREDQVAGRPPELR